MGILFITILIQSTVKNNTLLENGMPQALADGEFVVYFQPKVRVDTRTLVGAEALIRWKRDGKIISPADFIPIAERTGFIMKLICLF